MSEWVEYRLESIADVVDSLHKTPKYSNAGYCMVRVTDIKGGFLDLTDSLKVDYEVFLEFTKKYTPKKYDILMSRVGTYGNFSLVVSDNLFCLGQNTLIINSKSDNLFLYYYLTSPRVTKQIEEKVTGTTQKTISMKSIRELSIFLPPLPEQKAIADTLSCLDDKIESNNKINQTLEEMAQVIFKSWFVDFEPFGGEMPEDWESGSTIDFFDIKIGKTPPRKESQWFSTNSCDVKWLSIADMGKDGLFSIKTKEFLTEEAIDKFNISFVSKDTVLLSFKLTVGRVSIASETLVTNEAIAHFNTENNLLREYTYLYLKNFEFAKLGSTSSIATAVNSKTIKNMDFVMPSEEILEKFNNLTKVLFDIIQKNQQENQTLTEIRNTLLPKLMSGEVRVPLEI